MKKSVLVTIGFASFLVGFAITVDACTKGQASPEVKSGAQDVGAEVCKQVIGLLLADKMADGGLHDAPAQ